MLNSRRVSLPHDFAVLWVGQTINELGSRMSMFVFPLLAYALTGSALVAAAAETCHLLGMAGALLPAGVLADRFDRRRLMRIASGSGALLYASLAVAAATGGLAIPHLLAVALLTGAGAGTFAPAEISAVRAIVPAAELPTALAQIQARQHVASLLGAPVGGALYAVARWVPFAVDASTFAISWVLLGRIRTNLSAPASARARSARGDLRSGLRFVRDRPFLRAMMLWSAGANLAINALFFVAVLRLIEAGTEPVQIGLVETAAATFGIAGSIVAPRIIDRYATGTLTVVVAWSFVPLVIPMIFWNHPAVVAAALGLGLFLNPAGNAGIGAYRIAMTPAELQGRVQSTMQFVSMSSMPLAPVLAGTLLSWLGGGPAIAVLAALTAAVALIPTLSTAIRSVPRPAEWRHAVAADAASPLPGR